ncbi:hypothetical protein [Chryseobacterium viscerum]|uniref:Uncharacterized protein n=1 Tax=Chryseobacterium viscerum TaxID=1037377 RepID=A0A5N4BML8_9FLAO|nr:hypothetical protein [Chryseobacterium viscerum]KAB1229650.1 hypothetical protein F8D52_17275 [Chryseobacterium viscerum]
MFNNKALKTNFYTQIVLYKCRIAVLVFLMSANLMFSQLYTGSGAEIYIGHNAFIFTKEKITEQKQNSQKTKQSERSKNNMLQKNISARKVDEKERQTKKELDRIKQSYRNLMVRIMFLNKNEISFQSSFCCGIISPIFFLKKGLFFTAHHTGLLRHPSFVWIPKLHDRSLEIYNNYLKIRIDIRPPPSSIIT